MVTMPRLSLRACCDALLSRSALSEVYHPSFLHRDWSHRYVDIFNIIDIFDDNSDLTASGVFDEDGDVDALGDNDMLTMSVRVIGRGTAGKAGMATSASFM